MDAKTILIVDDAEPVRAHMQDVLSEAGYRVVAANDGQAAMERLESDAALDLVLCDLNMPRMNGLELLEAATKAGITKKIPFVILTTESDPRVVRQAKELGAQGWVVKPFRSERMVALIERLVG